MALLVSRASFDTSNITNYIQIYCNHFCTCNSPSIWGSSQGVSLLGRQNCIQVWAIRQWRVWGSWYPSKSLCLYEPTMSKTEPANSSSIKEHFSGQNYRQAVLVRVWRMQLCSHTYVRITGLLNAPLVLRIGIGCASCLQSPLYLDKSQEVNKAASFDWLVVNC